MTAPIMHGQFIGSAPDRLWSLFDMRKVAVGDLLHVMRLLTETHDKDEADGAIPESSRIGIRDKLGRYDADFLEFGLSGSVSTIRKMVELTEVDDATWKAFSTLCKELTGRLVDEARMRQFFTMTLREADWYANPRRAWESTIDRFPAIGDDVEEAFKCFALSRYPAAIFHSVQIIEAGLIDLGEFLRVTDSRSGWTAVASALQKVIQKKHQDKTQFERKNFEFLEQLQGLVEGLKNAWRNKISHASGRLVLISKEFSPEIAEEILLATRAFMRKLAEELPPKPVKKRKRALRGKSF